MSDATSLTSRASPLFDPVALDFRGLVRIYLDTWPYVRTQLAHFVALLAITWTLIGFGTAVGFLGFDILWDSVGRAEPISANQAAIMALEAERFVSVAALSPELRPGTTCSSAF